MVRKGDVLNPILSAPNAVFAYRRLGYLHLFVSVQPNGDAMAVAYFL